MDLTIVIPTLNEISGAPSLVSSLNDLFSIAKIEHEILVIDGGSIDGTREAVQKAGARVLLSPDRGYGAALRVGLRKASGQFILTMDGDGSHPPAAALELWKSREKSDLAIGSRYVPGGSARMPLLRLMLSRVLNAATRAALGFCIKDASSGLRLYRAEIVRSLPLRSPDFSIQQEALALVLRRGGTVKEIPFEYRLRIGGKSKASALALGPSYIKLFFRLKAATQ
ncbi:MAG: glycosyltransferase family 2 protein [Elusimicrobiota bacterium]